MTFHLRSGRRRGSGMLRTRIITTIGVVTLAMTVPMTAGAQQRDLRSPDARDASVTAAAGRDFRSPDARDAAARSIAPVQASDPVVTIDRARDGFGWGDAGIGAAGMLGILLALAGIALLATYQRRRDQVPVARQ